MSKSFSPIFLLCCALFITACATTEDKSLGSLPQIKHQDVDKALSQAEKRKGEQSINMYLAAIDLAWQQGDTLKARALLDAIDLSQATPAQKMFANTVAAELANDRGQSSAALQLLSGDEFLRFTELPIEQQARTQLARATALEKVGRPLAAARERIYTAPYLTGQDAIDNHEQIWQLISQLPSSHYQNQNEPDLDGWLDLARLTKSSDSLEHKQQQIDLWLKQNPSHPAAITLPSELQNLQQLKVMPVERIAILLPSQDPNQKVVDAIRNGILSAYYNSLEKNSTASQLLFYDSSKLNSLADLYRQLEQDKIDVLVGPWEKKLVRILADQPRLPLTTLALNYAENQERAPSQLFQFGLAAEDEARMAADKAWDDGLRNAVILVQEGEWGSRIQQAFTERWQAHGGQVVGARRIAQPVELAQQIGSLLQLSESEARHKKLQQLLQTKLHSQPTRRRDIDFVFLAAAPQQARQIKPTLRFQYAGDLPIYATSAINPATGNNAPSDLDEILLTEIPWLLDHSDQLRQDIVKLWPEAEGTLGRFYAMGADAFMLASQLQQLQALPGKTAHGFTGAMQLNDIEQIERKLHWAKFVNGKLTPVLQDELE